MATRLKDTDVVIIGLGAAGGVAALPLAQAGLDVIGLEAGTWLTRRDFAPDELRNNFRGWPQAVQKANQEIPTSRATASSPTGPRGNIHPMKNGVGGTDAALLGAELAAEPVGLQGRQRDDAPLRRLADSEGIDRRGLAVRLRGARAVLRQDRVRGRRLRAGRQHQRHDRSARQQVRGAAQARLSDAAAARHGLHREDDRCRARASAGIRFPARRRSTRAPIRTDRAACITASATAAAATSTRRTRRR